MSSAADQYNLAAIRSLILSAFTPKELWRFCADRPSFREAIIQFGVNPSLADMADVLLEYCETRLLLDELLAAIHESNPRQFERYQAVLHGGGPLPTRQIPHNLPPRSEFVGRDKEKARTHEALCSRWPLISIEGIGGIGKTALALEVAYECLQASRSEAPPAGIVTFDSFVWASAKDRDLTLNALLDAIALTLDYPGIMQRPLDQKSAGVEKLLRDKSCLLIVDNFETITDEGIQGFLRSLPEPSKALITTREQKLSNAWTIPLKGLEQAEALALIRSEGHGLGLVSIEEADDRTLLRLYEATGGAPLALKWAVGQIKQRGQTLDSVLAAIHEAKGPIFDEIFSRSWALLSSDARWVLKVMPLFASSASKAAIEAASDVHHFNLDEALGQLVEISLLDTTGELNSAQQRYSIHPLTRTYVIERIHELAEQEFAQQALERLLSHYIDVVAPPAEIRMGDPYWDSLCNSEAASSLRIEWDNLACLIHWALDAGAGQESQAIILDGAVDWPAHLNPNVMALSLFLPLVHRMHVWGLWTERVQLSRAMCAAAQRIRDPVEAWLWIDAVGYILQKQQQFQACMNAIETGRAVAHSFDLTNALILADAFEVWVCMGQGELDLAEDKVRAVLAQVEADPPLEGSSRVYRIVASRVYATASGVSFLRGNHDRAWAQVEQEMELRRAIGEYRTPILSRLGQLRLWAGDWRSAETYFTEALEKAEPKDEAGINYGLAQVARQKNDLQTARSLGEKALRQFLGLGMENLVYECQAFLASLSGPVKYQEQQGEQPDDDPRS